MAIFNIELNDKQLLFDGRALDAQTGFLLHCSKNPVFFKLLQNN
jgi:hypothetical protein